MLLEAQLAGTPVVAPAHGGSGDAYLDGVTGRSPVNESPEALADVLAELIADEVCRKELGQAAAAWSRARFEPRNYGDRVVRTMLGVAGLTPAARPPDGTGE